MSDDLIDQADDLLEEQGNYTVTLDEFLEKVRDDPSIAAHASKYVLNAIEAHGTRKVIEEGEEKERWVFFDDPYNDGENAVLGNTEILNQFVKDLRQLASDYGKQKQMMWFGGPTATGKSELKRCIINGLKGYSQTDEGRRYTYEWNIETRKSESGPGWGEYEENERDWYVSPVQSNPLTVLPEKTREQLMSWVEENKEYELIIEEDMDPFSNEAYDLLKRHYHSSDTTYSDITDKKHLRITDYTVDVGQGIGVLHSEDTGSPKERLVGGWMRGMLQKLNSRGRKNPQAFSYDGVLAQGNSGVTIVEDASQHADILQKLLNVPEEGTVKLDNKISMDIDTVLILISNPDLDETLNKNAAGRGPDPLKPLKRRLDKYKFTYLTNISLESELIRREVTNNKNIWTNITDDRIREPLYVNEAELSPHTIEASAIYEVVTRLDPELPDGFDYVDKALLMDRGYHIDEDGNRVSKDEFEEYTGRPNQDHGIPVTYTRDIIGQMVQENEVILPHDLLEAMEEGLETEAMFSNEDVEEYQDRLRDVEPYILQKMENDVINAIMRDKGADKDSMNEYVSHVFTWSGEREEVEKVDPLKMKVFETEYLGFSESDYDGTDPSEDVREFREQDVVNAIGRYAWRHHGNDKNEFEVEEIPLREIPAFSNQLGSYNWESVQEAHDNLDPHQWDDPPKDTETERIKEECIQNLTEMYEYSEESARRTSLYVFEEGDYTWD